MNIQHIPALRIIVAILAFVAILTQIFVTPLVARSFAGTYPEAAYLASPYTIAVIIAIVGIEVALVAGWKMLSITKREGSFTDSSLGWINLMTTSLIFAAAVFAMVFAHASFVVNVGGPAMIFGLLASIVFGASAIFFRASVKRNFPRSIHGASNHGVSAI